jgi:hypothetical protein
MLAFRHFDCQSRRILPEAAGLPRTQCLCALAADSDFRKTRNQLGMSLTIQSPCNFNQKAHSIATFTRFQTAANSNGQCGCTGGRIPLTEYSLEAILNNMK